MAPSHRCKQRLPGSESKLEIADIFRAHAPAWRRANAGHVSLSQLKVMSSVEACRTEALGGHVAACGKCNHQHIAYNSCKNRHCPKCQGPAARDWMTARAESSLPVEYFHVVFTLPAEIARIAYWNKKAVYGLLFKVSAQAVTTIAADPKRLGARVGMTSVLHTWGSALTHHPHIHMIVPGGGLSPDGTRWVACKPGFFLHVRVLSRLFRRLFIEGLLDRAGEPISKGCWLPAGHRSRLMRIPPDFGSLGDQGEGSWPMYWLNFITDQNRSIHSRFCIDGCACVKSSASAISCGSSPAPVASPRSYDPTAPGSPVMAAEAWGAQGRKIQMGSQPAQTILGRFWADISRPSRSGRLTYLVSGALQILRKPTGHQPGLSGALDHRQACAVRSQNSQAAFGPTRCLASAE